METTTTTAFLVQNQGEGETSWLRSASATTEKEALKSMVRLQERWKTLEFRIVEETVTTTRQVLHTTKAQGE